MRNAAATLGIIGGLWGMIVGFFSFGYTELAANFGEVEQMFGMFDNPGFVRVASFVAPLLAIAGGAMAKSRALWGGGLLGLSALAMAFAFGWGVFTMFPIGMCALGGLLAIAAGKPDEPKAHF